MPNIDKTQIDWCIFSGSGSVISGYICFVEKVKVSFEPLNEFEVILVLGFTQFFYINVFLDFTFGERLLQNFIIANELPLIPSSPVNSSHSYLTGIHDIDNLTIDSSSTELLYYFDIQLKSSVDPIEKVCFRDEESSFHHTDALILIHCIEMFINAFKMIKMITIISIVLMVQLTQATSTTQKFLYKADDNVTILPNSTIEMTIELSTASDQYLGDSSVMTTLDIQRSVSTPIPYDILYFSYWLEPGENCYKEWMVSGSIPMQIPCMTLVDDQYDNLPICARYTNCSSEQINVTLGLKDQIFRYSYVLVQNSQSQSLDLHTCIKLELSSDNGWFYWGVGLTCFLLISLVVFAGFVFYWMLKYKRVKKMFEQFKLTEESIIKED